MEVESRPIRTTKPVHVGSIIHETIFYNFNIPMRFNSETSKDNVLNKTDVNTRELFPQNVKIVCPEMKVPINMMPPPPPHKIASNNNYIPKKWERKENGKEFRAISPRGYDSDENCTSFTSRSAPPDRNGTRHSSRQSTGRLSNQTEMFGKYSRSSPSVYHTNVHHSSHNKQRYTNNNNNRQKFTSHYRSSTDIMIRRAHGLVERFKSRATLLKIEPNPPGLLNGGPLDQLNQSIWDVFSGKAQKEKTYQSKITIWKTIFLYIRKCLSSYGLFMVGSTMSGFGLESSDIDMCLLTKPCTSDPRLDAVHHLNNVRHLLTKYGLAVNSELILAKVPILKFTDKQTGFEIDLNCNNSVGIRNTHLLYCYARLDWRVRPLVVMVKLWAHANNINDAKNMTISSYSWALMVIHFLQCGVAPPVLPCLHGLVPERFNSDPENHSMDVQEEITSVKDFKSDNTSCLAELFIGFLQYYSYFDYSQCAISVRAGSRLPIDECRFMKAPKNDIHQWKFLCIEEPFDFTNTARSVFDGDIFKHIKDIIYCSYTELVKTKMLSNILPVRIDISHEFITQR